METKYGFMFDKDALQANVNRLTNQIWKLIPMRENNEPWQNQLETVIVELTGLYEIFSTNPQFIMLLSKLEGLKIADIKFEIHRKTVFESISLLREIFKNEK